VLYQFRHPFVLDDSATWATYGIQPTPWESILAETSTDTDARRPCGPDRRTRAMMGCLPSRSRLLCEVPMRTTSRSLAAGLAAAALLLGGCGGEAEQVLDDARERASELGDRVSDEVDSARARVDEAGGSAGQVQGALDEAEQAAQQAQDALEEAGSEAGASGQQALEEARSALDGADARLDQAKESVPESLQSALDEVRRRLAELRDQIDRAL
jgi:ElaB/YqjD/DUF883 family membrane-anchored ribosome-binding protein